MYSMSYMKRMEITGMQFAIENLEAAITTPPEQLEILEEGTFFENLLKEAVTPEEQLLLKLVDSLVDKAQEFTTRKGLRGELRKMFTSRGFSKEKYYMAFHAIESRI